MPRTAGALPATHGGDTGIARVCQLCRNRSTKTGAGALPALQGCRAATQPALQGHGAMQGCRAATQPALQGHCPDRELPPVHRCRDSGHCLHCRNTTHPSLQGHRALPRQGQSSTALPALPTQQHCQPRTARYEGTTHPALQGCRSPMHHPPRTARGALPPLCTPHRKRGTAHPCIRGTQPHCPPCAAAQTYPPGQTACLPAEQRHCTAPAHCNGRHSISPLLHSH